MAIVDHVQMTCERLGCKRRSLVTLLSASRASARAMDDVEISVNGAKITVKLPRAPAAAPDERLCRQPRTPPRAPKPPARKQATVLLPRAKPMPQPWLTRRNSSSASTHASEHDLSDGEQGDSTADGGQGDGTVNDEQGNGTVKGKQGNGTVYDDYGNAVYDEQGDGEHGDVKINTYGIGSVYEEDDSDDYDEHGNAVYDENDGTVDGEHGDGTVYGEQGDDTVLRDEQGNRLVHDAHGNATIYDNSGAVVFRQPGESAHARSEGKRSSALNSDSQLVDVLNIIRDAEVADELNEDMHVEPKLRTRKAKFRAGKVVQADRLKRALQELGYPVPDELAKGKGKNKGKGKDTYKSKSADSKKGKGKGKGKSTTCKTNNGKTKASIKKDRGPIGAKR